MINKQDFLNAINQDIDMIKGDTLIFNFELQGLGEETPDAITFSCADNINTTPLFTADLTDGISLDEYNSYTDERIYSVRIAPNKTKDLDINRYYYDLQLELNNEIFTLMRGRLTLLYDITRG